MIYYNADGKEGSMCGNGGRCIVAFAKKLAIIGDKTTFEAIDGLHYAKVEADLINLQMSDIENIEIPLRKGGGGAALGIAYVSFKETEGAISAYATLDKSYYQGRKLHILPA